MNIPVELLFNSDHGKLQETKAGVALYGGNPHTFSEWKYKTQILVYGTFGKSYRDAVIKMMTILELKRGLLRVRSPGESA